MTHFIGMGAHSYFVEGGGWVTRKAIGRPRARFFGFFSVLWLGVCLCASAPFWEGWPETFSSLDWLCLALILPQPVFIVLAGIFWWIERPRVVTELHPNPERDLRKLY